MSSKQRIINLLTICRCANKAVIGFDAVSDAVKNKTAYCVMVSSDISANSLKEVNFICNKYDVPVLNTPLTKLEYSNFLRKQTAVIAICDAGFGKKFVEICNENSNT